MPKDIYIFKRIEKKYLIDQKTKNLLLSEISSRLVPDSHGKSTVCSLYLDTPNYRIIRNSIEARVYKEKLRLRCYGTPHTDSKVFLEIKKKFKGVVYKRRVGMTLGDAYNYISNSIKPCVSQIMSEIDYCMKFYNQPKPMALISYEREAYFAKEHPDLRITFDWGVRYRTQDLLLENGSFGKPLLGDGQFIMEIKTAGAMPKWLSEALDKYRIFPRSFSKYGNAYREFSSNLNEPRVS